MAGANSDSEIWGKRDVEVEAVAEVEDIEELDSGRK